MYKHIFATLTFVTLASSFGGCSSDSSGGTTGGALDGADCHKITVDPLYTSQKCNNADDRCYLLDHNSDVRKEGGTCAITPAPNGCIGFVATPDSADAIKCNVDCLTKALQTKTGGSVSAACAECSAAVVTCGARYCLNDCIQDPNSAACTACLCADHSDAGADVGNCLQDHFARCAGFRPTNAQVGCP
jgi:hypothetical protein